MFNKIHYYIGLCLFTIFISATVQSQTAGLNFQGVARNPNGIILASQNISLRFSILNLSATGTIEYMETKMVLTNAQGIFSIVIGDGSGTINLGTFTNIDWKQMPKFLKVELDPTAGNNFITMGTTQLQTVPYANYSNYSAAAGSIDASNIIGLIPVARGGTGVNNIIDFKRNLQLNNVNNTSDTAKPISNLTKTALDLKLNKEDSLILYITPTQLKKHQIDTLSLSSRIDSKVPLTRTITINGNTSNLNTDGIFTIPAIATLNGLTSLSQHFEINNQGITPAITSRDSIHTINLPIASTPLVTAGLIAKVDYDQFYNKSDFSGNYDDLVNKPIIPSKQIQSDWLETDTANFDFIKNKPIFSRVATSGSYSDLSDKPTTQSLGAIPLNRSITINGLKQDLSIDREWVVNPVMGGVSLEMDVKDVLPVLNGGTGSSVKNFVDLTNSQHIEGYKQFANSISVGDAPPERTAIVDINSTNKGFLPPRMSTAQRDAILNPAIGLTIFNTDRNCLEWWIGSIWYNACGNASVSTTTNGTAAVTILDCLSGTAMGVNGGSYDIGTDITSANSWQVLRLKVNTIGTYNFMASANGITYSAIGQFYESDRLASISGYKDVYMYASGAALNAGTFTYKLATLPSCTFTNNVNTTSSNGSSFINAFDNTAEVYGDLIQGQVVENVYQKIRAYVTTPGTYKILTTQNGITFTGSGNFPSSNALYDVVLTGSGVPISAGTYTFTTNTVPSKSFTRTVISPSTNGTAVVNSWVGNTASTGDIFASDLISGNDVTQTLTANVVTAGTYNLSAQINGVNFTATGVFSGTGSQTVQLVASGTATTIGDNYFNLNTLPSVSFTRNVLANLSTGGTGVVSTWENNSDFGTMTVGNTVNYVTHSLNAYVSKLGTYNLYASSNGVNFTATGTFKSLGNQTIVLNASGVPIAIENSRFTLSVSNPPYFDRSILPNPSTNGTAIISNWSGGNLTGNFYVNKIVSGATYSVTANVTRVGTYNIDFVARGITFAAVGTFTNTGSNNVIFTLSGTPNAIDNNLKLLLSSLSGLYSSPSMIISPNPSSNGTASITGWTIGEQSGSGYVGQVVQDLSKVLIADVTAAGTYSISTNVNGVTFAATGTFAGTGSQTVRLVASGTPTNLWNTIYTTNTSPSKTFTVQYYSKSTNGTAVVSSWTNGTLSAPIYQYASLNSINYSVIANVTTIGTYNISVQNMGLIFTASGTFTSTGSKTVVLTASGAANDAGTFQFNLNTVPSLSFNVDVLSQTSNGTSFIYNITVGNSYGTLYYGLAASGVTKEIKVKVTKIGTYNIETTSLTGVKFKASGTFTSVGDKTITLVAEGIVTDMNYYVYTLNVYFNTNITFGFRAQAPPVGTRLANNAGIVAYIFQPEDYVVNPNGKIGLIAAVSDQSSGIVWSNSLTSVGNTSLDLGTGYSNTASIFPYSTVMNAVFATTNYNSGFNNGLPEEWFLPSNDELYKIYLNRALIGGFNQRYYWTSSETDASTAVARDFVDGVLTFKIKTSTLAVRAIRYF